MRLELPLKISVQKTAIFAAVIVCVQLMEGSGAAFSLLFGTFVMLSVVTFNYAGGFSRASGSYVFWFALLVVIVGVVWKAFVNEPADSNLRNPLLDMSAYTVSMALMLMTVIITRRVLPNPKGLGETLTPGEIDYTKASIGCMIAGLLISGLNIVAPEGILPLLRIINQLNLFFNLGIILGTIGAIRDSQGVRAINFITGAGMLLFFFQGLTAFSKQGMVTPLLCWLMGAFYARLNLRRVHYLVIGAAATFIFVYATPISAGREIVGENPTFGDRISALSYTVTHLKELNATDPEQAEREAQVFERIGYFNTGQGLVERLNMMAVDDYFIDFSERGNYDDFTVIWSGIRGWLPHLILADKDTSVGTGNYYAHEMGAFVPEDDFNTGISFSPVSAAYHLGGWSGLLLVLPAVWFAVFASTDWICGDLRRAPWGLLAVVHFGHLAPESLIQGLIYYISYGNLATIVGILFCVRIAPVLGRLFYGKADEGANLPGINRLRAVRTRAVGAAVPEAG